jgi:uncharacterized protein (TIGR03067 family)
MRQLVLLIVVALSLAFAPAPLPRPKTEKASVAVKDLVGTWRVGALYHLPDKALRDPAKDGVTHVTISLTQWVFKGRNDVTYDLRIDPMKKPAEFDLMRPGQKEAYGRGLIRREGDAIRVVYRWGSGRPTSFENQRSGCELMLVREKAR